VCGDTDFICFKPITEARNSTLVIRKTHAADRGSVDRKRLHFYMPLSTKNTLSLQPGSAQELPMCGEDAERVQT
jgi:hypothetical protein